MTYVELKFLEIELIDHLIACKQRLMFNCIVSDA